MPEATRPPEPTTTATRRRIKEELTTLAAGLNPITFWETYFLVGELAIMVGMNSKPFRQWLRSNKFEIVTKRNPATGKRSNFVTVETARKVIKTRM